MHEPDGRDVSRQRPALDRQTRRRNLGQTGATVWLTGLPASGKSTIADALERRLVDEGRVAYVIDGDSIRRGLSDDLGFSPGDRAENVRRVGHVTRLFADAGAVAIASLISPLRADRRVPRRLHDEAGLTFIEVHVDTSLEECIRRDPKGLYRRAAAGELRGLTGVDGPYEAPLEPELRLPTAELDVECEVEKILALLPPR